MNFSELFTTVTNVYKGQYKKIENLSDLGGFTFGRGITDKEEQKTPHYVMDRCLTMAIENSIVTSALEQLMTFIFPNNRIRIKSKHARTLKFLTTWVSQRRKLAEELRKILFANLATGNGILQYKFAKDGILDNVFSLNDVSRVYYNSDHKDVTEEFIYQVPLTVKSFYFDGKLNKPQFYNVKYIAGDVFFVKIVFGIPIDGRIIDRYKTGWTRDGWYGRSSLSACIDVDNIMREIMSSWDTISKLKQIDQKIITPDGNAMYDVANQQYSELIKMLEEGRGSFLFVPFPVKLLQQDVRTSKGYDTMTEVIEFLRKMIMMGLLPQHLTPWGQSSTTQGSEASLPPFQARVKAKQEEFIQFLNGAIIGKLRETYKWIAEDASFEFDAPEVMGEEYYLKMITNLRREGIITPFQAITWLKSLGVIRPEVLEAWDKGEDKVLDPFRVIDKDALTFKPNDDDARKDALRIANAVKQKEEEEKQKLMYAPESGEVVGNYMNQNRQQAADEIENPKKDEKPESKKDEKPESKKDEKPESKKDEKPESKKDEK